MLVKEKINITTGNCGCGKECPEWDNLMREKVLNKFGEYEDRDIVTHIGYPQNHCHCACGLEFGQHDYQLKLKPKKRCVVCRARISPKDYEENGNYCLHCCIKADTAGRKKTEHEIFVKQLHDADATTSSDTGLGEDQ